MPVSYDAQATATSKDANELAFGAAPHFVLKEKMIFDPVMGGWTSMDAAKGTHRAKSPAKYPPHWAQPQGGSPPRLRDKHIEKPHYGDFRLNMKTEVDLGIMPPEWSVTSTMSDARPLGRPQFDARFVESPVGRARGGRNMDWTPVGTADAGMTSSAPPCTRTLTHCPGPRPDSCPALAVGWPRCSG